MTRLTLAALILSAAPLAAQPVGDPERGRQMAEEVCAECHAVRADEQVMKDYPPSFWAIARYRDDVQVRARIWAPPAHAQMPYFAEILFPNQVEDLVAYIRGLEE